jgi:hypothetical protein
VVARRLGLEQFEAHPPFMDAVGDGLELGDLVDLVLWGGDLAAVMQQGGDMYGLPALVFELEGGEGALPAHAGRFGQ